MTIISRKTSGFELRMSVVLIIALIVALSFWTVMLYSSLVAIQHDARALEDSVQKLKVENADFKNAVFEGTSPKRLLEFAAANNLVKVQSPSYLEITESAWSVSRY